MTIFENYKKNWDSIKNRSAKEKFEYLADYYKWYVIGFIIAIVFIAYIIYTNVTAKDTALHGIFMNSFTSEEERNTFAEEIASELAIDTSEYHISLNTNLAYLTEPEYEYSNYEMLQSLQVWYAAGEMDFLVGNHMFMTMMAYQGFFSDLSEVLSEEQYIFYKPYFHYIDGAILNSKALSGEVVLPDSTVPESMEDPIPVFIDISKCDKLSSIYNYDIEQLFFGIMPNAPHRDTTLHLLDYLMENK